MSVLCGKPEDRGGCIVTTNAGIVSHWYDSPDAKHGDACFDDGWIDL